MGSKSNKRERLINSAKELFYKQGFNNTTIADIAKLADVPLGNVYYYFKTKDEICTAVIREYNIDMNNMIAEFDKAASAKDKLNAIVDFYAQRSDEVAQYGNIFSSLIEELAKLNNSLVSNAQEVLNTKISWLTKQFESFYAENDAKTKAIEFLTKLHGILSLTLAFRDSNLMTKHADMLKNDISKLDAIAA